MICKHKICSSGKKIIPNKRTKISTWELAGTFKDFHHPPTHTPQRERKQILVFKKNKIALHNNCLPLPQNTFQQILTVTNHKELLCFRNKSAAKLEEKHSPAELTKPEQPRHSHRSCALEQPPLATPAGWGAPTFPHLSPWISLPGGANRGPPRPPNSGLHHLMQISSSRQEDLCVFTGIAHLSANRSEGAFCFKWNWKCPLNQQKVSCYAVKHTSGLKIKLRVTKPSAAIVHATVFSRLDI